MIIDKSGKIFEDRRITERRTKFKPTEKIGIDKRKSERRKTK